MKLASELSQFLQFLNENQLFLCDWRAEQFRFTENLSLKLIDTDSLKHVAVAARGNGANRESQSSSDGSAAALASAIAESAFLTQSMRMEAARHCEEESWEQISRHATSNCMSPSKCFRNLFRNNGFSPSEFYCNAEKKFCEDFDESSNLYG